MIFHPAISAPFVGFCSEKHPLHVLKPCKIRAETVHLLSDKQNRPIPYRLDGIGLSDRTSKSSHGGSHIEQSIFFPLHHRDNRNSPASLLFRIFLLKSGFQILPLSMQCLSMFHLFLAKRLSKRFLKPMPLQRILRFSIGQYILYFFFRDIIIKDCIIPSIRTIQYIFYRSTFRLTNKPSVFIIRPNWSINTFYIRRIGSSMCSKFSLTWKRMQRKTNIKTIKATAILLKNSNFLFIWLAP